MHLVHSVKWCTPRGGPGDRLGPQKREEGAIDEVFKAASTLGPAGGADAPCVQLGLQQEPDIPSWKPLRPQAFGIGSYARNYINDLGVTYSGRFQGGMIDSPLAHLMNTVLSAGQGPEKWRTAGWAYRGVGRR